MNTACIDDIRGNSAVMQLFLPNPDKDEMGFVAVVKMVGMEEAGRCEAGYAKKTWKLRG